MNSAKDEMPKDPTLTIKLAGQIHGIVHTQLIFVAAKLGIADHLAGGARSIEELAVATNSLESRLYRIMRALVSIGVFAEPRLKYFELNPAGELLRSSSTNSLKDFAIMMGSPWHAGTWANILHSVSHDESSFKALHQEELFEYLAKNPDAGAVFNNAMTFTSQKQADAVCQAYVFPESCTLVDVAGGHGYLLSTLLLAHPSMSGILFDLPAVASTAGHIRNNPVLKDRCRIIEGSFFEDIPQGGDIYILKYIIHDWDDGDALKILHNCRKAMSSQSTLLIIDAIVPQLKPSFGKTWADIEMMVLLPNGRERTESEFRHLIESAGLTLNRIIPMRSELSILEVVLKPTD